MSMFRSPQVILFSASHALMVKLAKPLPEGVPMDPRAVVFFDKVDEMNRRRTRAAE